MSNEQPLGWYQDPDDSKIVRHWDGYVWSDPVSVEFAQLKELTTLERTLHRALISDSGKLNKIAFRVGFLALMVLIGIVVAFLSLPAALLGL